jgi:hypothetical protein
MISQKGTLTLKGPTEKRSNTNIIYRFQCTCGAIVEMSMMAFKQAVFPTCKREECKAQRITRARLPRYEAAWNRLFAQYKSQAEKRHMPFELTRQEAIVLFQSPCRYCGRPPSRQTRIPDANGQVLSNGVDRYLNAITVGYTTENSVPCCAICNFRKGSMDGDVFLAHIRRIATHRNLLWIMPAQQVIHALSQTSEAGSFARSKGDVTPDKGARRHVSHT